MNKETYLPISDLNRLNIFHVKTQLSANPTPHHPQIWVSCRTSLNQTQSNSHIAFPRKITVLEIEHLPKVMT